MAARFKSGETKRRGQEMKVSVSQTVTIEMDGQKFEMPVADARNLASEINTLLGIVFPQPLTPAPHNPLEWLWEPWARTGVKPIEWTS